MLRVIASFILICGLAMPAHSKPQVRQVGGPLGTLSKVNFTSCVKEICIHILSEKVVRGFLINGYSFKNAEVKIESKSKIIEKFHGEGFYDVKLDKIYFSDIKDSKFKEAYFKSNSGEFFKL